MFLFCLLFNQVFSERKKKKKAPSSAVICGRDDMLTRSLQEQVLNLHYLKLQYRLSQHKTFSVSCTGH